MTYETYRYIFIVGAILSGIMLAVAVLLFFLLHIPTVIGDITGRNARRGIEEIRGRNFGAGNKSAKLSSSAGTGAKQAGKSSAVVRPVARSFTATGRMGTAKLSTVELLHSAQETTLLKNAEHDDKGPAAPVYAETALLAASDASAFFVEYEICFIHTEEIIA